MKNNILHLITPISLIHQNNHTVKKSILLSLNKEYSLFKKFDFMKEIIKLDSETKEKISEEQLRQIFNKHITSITKNNSTEIFSSRLINNSLENERFARSPRNQDDIDFLKNFHDTYTNQNIDPPTIHLAEAAKRESVTFFTIENHIEKIFTKVRKNGDLTVQDIEDINIFSKFQICRHKNTILYAVNNTINEYNIDTNNLNSNHIETIRENVFRHQLFLKNQNNLFVYKYHYLLESNSKFWLGDCDTFYNEETITNRICYCLKCTDEKTSNCLWENVPIKEVNSCLFFLTPNVLVSFDKKQSISKDNLNLIQNGWNKNSLKYAFFHLIFPKEDIEQLFKTTLQLIYNQEIFIHSFKDIEKLYKVEQFLKKTKILPEEKLSKDNISILNKKIQAIKNSEELFLEFDVPLTLMKKVDNFFIQNKIHIYDDLHKHPMHNGLYVSKRIKLFNGNNNYIYYLSKGQ